jgi:hypothetical protein
MDLTTKLLSTVAAATLTAAALTFSTTTSAEASWASADACAAANGGDREVIYVDEFGWDCVFPSFAGDPSVDGKIESLRAACASDFGMFGTFTVRWYNGETVVVDCSNE